jgi:hypothetical protein
MCSDMSLPEVEGPARPAKHNGLDKGTGVIEHDQIAGKFTLVGSPLFDRSKSNSKDLTCMLTGYSCLYTSNAPDNYLLPVHLVI